MKKLLLGFAFLCAFILTSCVNLTSCPPPPSAAYKALLEETWLCNLKLNPILWTQCADPWFLNGEPNPIEKSDMRAPYDRALTKMLVRVPDSFVNININGGFQVQVVGGQDHNSVSIIGPNAGARRVAVEVRQRTLYIHETKPEKVNCAPDQSVKQVIVRIGVRTLCNLTNLGCGHIYGRDIFTPNLIINSFGRGNTMLVGKMNLRRVNQSNFGIVTVIGAMTPSLTIRAGGSGGVNISGRVGIQSIVNSGNATVRIAGADTDSLVIRTSGNSRTGIVGYTKLKEINASGCSRVYLYWVNTCSAYICVRDNARVGIAGAAQSLNVDLQGNSRFWGSYLKANAVYVHTHGESHANVATDQKIFANAENESSVYFFGSPSSVSRFYSGHGNVLPVSSNATCTPACSLPSKQSTCSIGTCYK